MKYKIYLDNQIMGILSPVDIETIVENFAKVSN